MIGPTVFLACHSQLYSYIAVKILLPWLKGAVASARLASQASSVATSLGTHNNTRKLITYVGRIYCLSSKIYKSRTTKLFSTTIHSVKLKSSLTYFKSFTMCTSTHLFNCVECSSYECTANTVSPLSPLVCINNVLSW